MDRTIPIDEVALEFELLTPDAIGTFVLPFVDVTLLLEQGEESLDTHHVAILSGTDEVIIGDIEIAPQRFPRLFYEAIAPILRCYLIRFRSTKDLLSMLICASEIPDRFTASPMPTSEYIAGDRGVGVAYMRRIVDVVDRRREVEGLGHWRILTSLTLDRIRQVICPSLRDRELQSDDRREVL